MGVPKGIVEYSPVQNSGLISESLWLTCLVSFPLPLRSSEEKETPAAHPLGLELAE